MPPMRKKNVIEVTNSITETSNDETTISDIMQTKANNNTNTKECSLMVKK